MELGFRSPRSISSPKADTRCRRSFVTWLTDNGFEVGVQDLHHDAKTLSLQRAFFCRVREDQSLHQRMGCGRVPLRVHAAQTRLVARPETFFTTPSTLRHTDPFEPQTRRNGDDLPILGAGRRAGRRTEDRGPEDRGGGVREKWGQENGRPDRGRRTESRSSTSSFDFDRERTAPPRLRRAALHPRPGLQSVRRSSGKTIDKWTRKLDWLVERGGMVLLDTHPDYMAFGGATPKTVEYPVEFYKDLLEYVRSKYRVIFWHALPVRPRPMSSTLNETHSKRPRAGRQLERNLCCRRIQRRGTPAGCTPFSVASASSPQCLLLWRRGLASGGSKGKFRRS
jgi:hypothetical protein